jgi:hypothetical protein
MLSLGAWRMGLGCSGKFSSVAAAVVAVAFNSWVVLPDWAHRGGFGGAKPYAGCYNYPMATLLNLILAAPINVASCSVVLGVMASRGRGRGRGRGRASMAVVEAVVDGSSTEEEKMDRKAPGWRKREKAVMEAADEARKKAMQAAEAAGTEGDEGAEGEEGGVIIATSATLPGSASTQHHGKEGDEVDAFIAKRGRRYPFSGAAEAPKEGNDGNVGKEGDGGSSSSTRPQEGDEGDGGNIIAKKAMKAAAEAPQNLEKAMKEADSIAAIFDECIGAAESSIVQY